MLRALCNKKILVAQVIVLIFFKSLHCLPVIHTFEIISKYLLSIWNQHLDDLWEWKPADVTFSPFLKHVMILQRSLWAGCRCTLTSFNYSMSCQLSSCIGYTALQSLSIIAWNPLFNLFRSCSGTRQNSLEIENQSINERERWHKHLSFWFLCWIWHKHANAIATAGLERC